MKKISSILILLVISIIFSCSNNDDATKNPNPTENGFTFNSEFFATNGLSVTFLPSEAYFFISVGEEFEENPRPVIVIDLFIAEFEALTDIEGTYNNIPAASVPFNEIPEGSFAAALINDVQGSTEAFFAGGGTLNEENTLPVNTGEVIVSYDTETLIFTLDFAFTTDEGTITGVHEGEASFFDN